MMKRISLLLLCVVLVCTSYKSSTGLNLTSIPQFSTLATEGVVTLQFTSLPNGATFSPKHVLAVWVEDQAGVFVKSLKVRADKRKQYLYSWNSKSAGNVVDATTGATLSAHQTHIVEWDRTDVSGEIVPDGDYSIVVEYTSAHAQGPLLNLDFTIGPSNVDLSPADESYFIDISLSYEAVIECMTLDGNATNPSCHGSNDGSIDVIIQGNNAPYTILWSTGDTTLNLDSIPAGTYDLTVSGTGGCVATASYNLTEPDLLTVNSVVTNNLCFGDHNAAIEVSPLGGTPPYIYSWRGGETTSAVDQLAAGNYGLTITDAKNCQVIEEFELIDPDELKIGAITGDTLVFKAALSSYSVTSRTGSTYTWEVSEGVITSGQLSHMIEVQWNIESEGSVKVSEESANGCKSDTSQIKVEILTTGLSAIPGHSVKVYPNPVSDILNIQSQEEVRILMLDQLGREVLKTNNLTVDVSELKSGIYTLLVYDLKKQTLLRKKILITD